MQKKYRLGLDMGSNSIGWCAVELDPSGQPSGVLDAGVRILTPNDEAGRDPKSKESLAANRRTARSARRRRDRFVRRQARLMETLVEAGLMPAGVPDRKALEKIDPYWLRARALDEPLELHEIGRAIFHLSQRRGFKSNRIAEASDSEASAMKQGMVELQAALAAENARTLGEYLARRHQRDRDGNRLARPKHVRFRPKQDGAKLTYPLYPYRDLIEAELDAIWAVQSKHHGGLNVDLLNRLKRIIVEQRPLKAPPVGRCTLRPEEDIDDSLGFEIDRGERAPKAHPHFQRFRILQDAGQLRVTAPGQAERKLTLTEYRAICGALAHGSGTSVAFDRLRKAAKLSDDSRFNYELIGRKGFPPDQTAAKLRQTKAFGKTGWATLPRERQIEVVERLLAVEDPEELLTWLCENFGLDEDQAAFVSQIRLPQGHAQFGRSLLADLVEAMERADDTVDPDTGEVHSPPLRYDEAVKALDLHHSKLSDFATHQRLPYYGEALARHVVARKTAPAGSQDAIGRVPNPTVHIGLNQLRAVVNALIDTYGPPDAIVMELARELKLNKKRKDEIQKQNRENEKKNDAIRAELSEYGFADTFGNRLLLRLYAELPPDERVCVYSGSPIGKAMLFNGAVDIDHILPYSKSLDDSFANKVLCIREMNRFKRNRAPGEAWTGAALKEIVERAERLFRYKAWRFQPDAMEQFDEKGGFQARHLVDTQHMSRMARQYLELVCDQVWVTPGRLTAMLRAKWALNDLLPDHNFTEANQPKNRKDHRHHAIDGFVLACTDRGLLNRISRESGRAEELDLDRLFPKDSFPIPFEGYRNALGSRLSDIVVSHKPDHGLAPGSQDNVGVTSGKLLEETAYGEVDEEIDGKRYNLVTRKPVVSLTPAEIARVRDAHWREKLREVELKAKRDGVKLETALAAFAEEHEIRRIRVLKREKSMRRIEHGDGFYKLYSPGDNHRIEIFELPDGSWGGEGVTTFDANTPGYQPIWRKQHPGAKLIMRLHNGDSVEADFDGSRKVYRVYRLEPSAKRVRMAEHNEAGSIDQRHNDSTDPLRWTFASYAKLKAAAARKVRVCPIGRVTPMEQAE